MINLPRANESPVDTRFGTRTITPYVGVEISGFDFSAPPDPEDIRQIKALADQHFILLFRDQPMTEAEQMRFSHALGQVIPPPEARFTSPENPMIITFGNVDRDGNQLPPDHAMCQYVRVPEKWHSDGSYKPVPNYLSILHAYESCQEGGETAFASMVAAYDALPDNMKDRIADLAMEHPYPVTKLKVGDWQGNRFNVVIHPLVRNLPGDIKALFLSPFDGCIVGMKQDESDALVRELFEFAISGPFTYYHKWRPGDTVIWNNRGLVHRAMPWDQVKNRRLMHRTEIAG